MNHELLALLRAGLWGEPPQADFARTDWTALHREASRQTVLGLTYDGLSLLPKEQLPPPPLKVVWGMAALRIEQLNRRLDQALAEVCRSYQQAGLHPVLLKGQGLAHYYRNPLRRQPGDIDLYFPPQPDQPDGDDPVRLADQVAAAWPQAHAGTAPCAAAGGRHTEWTWQGVVIENHRHHFRFSHPRNERRWQQAQRLLPLTAPETTLRVTSARGETVAVPLPAATMNVVYTFLHLFRHFTQTGVGLRQVCDWLVLVRHEHQHLDPDALRQTLRLLPIGRGMTALLALGETFLGLPQGLLPGLDTTTRRARADARLMLRDILHQGNFGKDTDMMRGIRRGEHLHNLPSYWLALVRWMRLLRLCPSEILAYPLRRMEED